MVASEGKLVDVNNVRKEASVASRDEGQDEECGGSVGDGKYVIRPEDEVKMCFGICLTRRGTVYFGASIHIFLTLILFVGTSIRAYRISTFIREDNRKELLGGAFIATYFFILLVLGCLIFRATEQKNSQLLGWCGGLFITLETLAFVFNLLLLSPMGSSYDDYGVRNFGFSSTDTFHIILASIFLCFMMIYCGAIIMYIRRLKEDARSRITASSKATAVPLSRSTSRPYFTGQSQSQGTTHRSHSQPQLAQDKDHKNLPDKTLLPPSSAECKLLAVIAQAKAQQQQLTLLQQHIFKHPQPKKLPQLNQGSVGQGSNRVERIVTTKPQLHTQSQTLPHPHQYLRSSTQDHASKYHQGAFDVYDPKYDYDGHYEYQRELLEQHRSSPASPALGTAVTTASITPSRYRNPNPVARVTAAGILTRYDSSQSAGSGAGMRSHRLQRQTSFSSGSVDKQRDPWEVGGDPQWEQPRVQALKYNYNALRRGTHRSDYGNFGVEV